MAILILSSIFVCIDNTYFSIYHITFISYYLFQGANETSNSAYTGL